MKNAERYEEYSNEYDRLSALRSQNLRQQDSVLIQLSVGLLAVMATLGEQILAHNKSLGFALMILLALTLMQAVAGFWLSDRFYTQSMKKLGRNYDRKKKLSRGLNDIWQGKVNAFFNYTIFITFGLALLIFVALVLNYISTL